MSSRLTTISDVTKKGFIALVISIILFFIGRTTFRIGYQWCCVKPTPTPTPYVNPFYGQLELPPMPEGVQTSSNLNLTLETVTGRLPESTQGARIVYELIKKTPDLNYSQKSQDIANSLEFKDILPTQIGEQLYLWQNPADPNLNLEIDVGHYNIKYKTENEDSYIAIQQGATPTIQNVIATAYQRIRNFRPDIIKNVAIENAFITNGVYIYKNPTTGEIQEVTTQQQANITKVDFTRAPIQNEPVIDPSTTTALVSFTHTGIPQSADPKNFRDRLLRANITYWSVNTNPSVLAVYPIRNSQQAWQDLQLGKGFVLSESNPQDQYFIRRVYLAYYNPPIYTQYMQPIWVFEGDKENDANFLFRAIVPAIQENYIKSN